MNVSIDLQIDQLREKQSQDHPAKAKIAAKGIVCQNGGVPGCD
jgi:hypothetical protein